MNTENVKTFNATSAMQAQAKYCKENKMPHFAPTHGLCFRCNKQIYSEINGRGVSVEKASTGLVTGCPHCNYSFVD